MSEDNSLEDTLIKKKTIKENNSKCSFPGNIILYINLILFCLNFLEKLSINNYNVDSKHSFTFFLFQSLFLGHLYFVICITIISVLFSKVSFSKVLF